MPIDTGREEDPIVSTAVPHEHSHRRAHPMVAPLIVLTFAIATALLTPRGPVTSAQAVATLVAAALVGAAIGYVSATKWNYVIMPAVYIAVFELVRIGQAGATVDAPALDSMLGWIAFITGRVLPGIFVIAPMLLSMPAGRLISRVRSDSQADTSRRAFIASGGGIVAVLALLVVTAMPAHTDAIVDSEGQPSPEAVAELTTVRIGEHEHSVMIRGEDTTNPVLLYIAGGPGGTDIGAVRADERLEEDFTVVTWEQRGAGKSYAQIDPLDTFTLEAFVNDIDGLSAHLRDRFDEDKIYLSGNSWGTTLAVLAAQRSPEQFHAYIGSGQMVSQRASDIMFWEDTLEWARSEGNDALVTTLEGNGPPPYTDVNKYGHVVSYEHQWNPYPEFDPGTEMPAILFVPEYSLMDRINAFRGFLDTSYTLYPQLQGIDFRQDVPALQVPVYVVMGEHEARGREVLAKEWFESLRAPHKELLVFEGTGHRPLFEAPDEYAALLSRIKEETYPS